MKKIQVNIFLMVVIFLALAFDIFLFMQKANFHVDEIFSYGSANSENGWNLFQSEYELNDQIITGEQIRAYLLPENGSFYGIWHSTLNDSPPLYFILFRSLSKVLGTNLLFPAMAFSVLVLFFILIGFYKLCFFLYKDKNIATIATGILGFSTPLISIAIYIRMYILLMLFSVWLVYYACLYADKFNKKDLFFVFLFVLFCFLTHCYGIIFCFLLASFLCFYMLFIKKYKNMFLFGLALLSAAAIFYLLFPEIIKIGWTGSRGEQFWDALKIFTERPLVKMKEQMPLFYDTLFYSFAGMCCFVLVFFTIFYISWRKKIISETEKKFFILSMFLIFSYGFILGLVMPVMRPYQIRYFAPVVPLFVLVCFEILLLIFKLINMKKKVMSTFLFIIFLFNMFVAVYTIDKNPFYMPSNKNTDRLNNIVKNADIWWGYGPASTWGWMIYMYMDKFIYANKIFSIADFDNNPYLLDFSEQEKSEKKYAYLFVYSKWEDKKMDIIENPIEWVNRATGRQAYYLFTTRVMVFEADVYLICPY